MDWEKELLWAMNRWSKANKVESDDNWGSLISWVKKLLRSQRSQLLKSLVEEVRGMGKNIEDELIEFNQMEIQKHCVDVGYQPKFKSSGYLKALDDVIKLLEKYE